MATLRRVPLLRRIACMVSMSILLRRAVITFILVLISAGIVRGVRFARIVSRVRLARIMRGIRIVARLMRVGVIVGVVRIHILRSATPQSTNHHRNATKRTTGSSQPKLDALARNPLTHNFKEDWKQDNLRHNCRAQEPRISTSEA
jgi:hypothetical protein